MSRSTPPYPKTHSGPVLVCGNAFCLREDLDAARQAFPDAPVIAVNGAAGETRAFALFTQHPRLMPSWIEVQRERFGDDFTAHAAGSAHLATKLGYRPDMPWINYWWEDVASGGTSVWGARRLAAHMGFDRVVLCGAPLVKGSYANGKIAKSFQNDGTLAHYRAQIERDVDWHGGVTSMSGWTRELLGAPA